MTCCFLSDGVAQSTAGRYTITLRQGNIGKRHFGPTRQVACAQLPWFAVRSDIFG